MAHHPQRPCYWQGRRIDIDAKLAPYVQRLWDAGIATWTSCQWEGPPDKIYPAYINPWVPGIPAYRVPHPSHLAAVLKLRRSQWRNYNGVLWLHWSLVQ